MTNLRHRVYQVVELSGTPIGRSLHDFTVGLMLFNVVALIIHSVPDVDAVAGEYLRLVTLFSVGYFSLEYLIRLWVCVELPRVQYRDPLWGRFRFVTGHRALVDLAALAALYGAAFTAYDFRFLLLLRLLKHLRHHSSLDTLVAAIRSERRSLASAGLVMLVLLVSVSSLIYMVERTAQPDKFGSIPQAMWWGVVTLTTVGYGDVVPVTPLGKLIGGMTTVLGFGMFALPAGILASAFAHELKKRDFVVTWGMVAKVPIFTRVNAGGIADIAGLLRPITVGPGERLTLKGEPAHNMYFIVSGSVKVEKNPPVYLKAGDFFGEVSLIFQSVRSASVYATTTCQLLELHADDFQILLEEHPELAEAIRQTAHRRRATDRATADITTNLADDTLDRR
ncbi:MAG: cyclic nucleotide-gated ion channel [Pseudomonadota bacterium]